MSSNFQKLESNPSYNKNNLSIVTPDELNFDDLDPSQGLLFLHLFFILHFFFFFFKRGWL